MSFDFDNYPGKLKILFIGMGYSSHTHSWIDLLSDEEINIRLFAVPAGGTPPENWPVRTYVTAVNYARKSNSSWREFIFSFGNTKEQDNPPAPWISPGLQLSDENLGNPERWSEPSELWLRQIIEKWKPDIIHTLGFFDNQGGAFYYNVRKKYHLEGYGKWLLQMRGGSDLTLRRLDPDLAPIISRVLNECDLILTDNEMNIDYAAQLGVKRSQFSNIIPVPGTGGIDVHGLRKYWAGPPSKRKRSILWPKVYDSPWAKMLPVFEGIKIAWEKIAPCELYLLSTGSSEFKMWFHALPESIRVSCKVLPSIPRQEALKMMGESRVMISPSLVDGVPNTLYEAMACGAFPIVSPLETIKSVLKNEESVLYARNLYPQEIAEALIRAMNDDDFVDRATENNFKFAQNFIDREVIKQKVVQLYAHLGDKSSSNPMSSLAEQFFSLESENHGRFQVDQQDSKAREEWLNYRETLINTQKIQVNEFQVRLFAQQVDLNKDEVKLNEREVLLNHREVFLNEKEVKMNNREVSLGEREVVLNQREVQLEEREVAQNNREVTLNEREVAQNNREVTLNEREVAQNNREVTLNEREVDLNQPHE